MKNFELFIFLRSNFQRNQIMDRILMNKTVLIHFYQTFQNPAIEPEAS